MLAEPQVVEDTVYNRRGEQILAWRSRAIPLLDEDGRLVAAVYWTALPTRPGATP